jgi:16S rRNA (guanine527-N7)-methyltransferase
MELLLKYFPQLNDTQLEKFSRLLELYTHWNAQINVISRKDMEHFYERHVLHSLAITKQFHFTEGTKLLDIGTGGGFPSIPLGAI